MFTAVIYITEYNEDFGRALKSINACSHLFKELIIVSNYKHDGVDTNGALEVKVCSKLTASLVTGDVILEIPPYCAFTESALGQLQEKIKYSSVEHTTFGIQTVEMYSSNPANMMWYGLILVSIVWDWIQSVWDRGKLYNHNDIVARAVITKGGKRYITPLPHTKWVHYIYNPDCVPKIYRDDCVVKYPANTVVHRLAHHKHYGFSLWLLYYFFYYVALILVCTAIVQGAVSRVLLVCFIVFQWACVMLITNAYVNVKLRPLLALFYPLYYLAFPVCLLVAKFYKPKTMWK
jgi:hypothetical protein